MKQKTIDYTWVRPLERGATLLELIASLLIASIALTFGTKEFIATIRADMDRKTQLETEEKARTILETIAYDIRMIGAGMPINQANFLPETSGLDDAPLPILTTSTATQLDFRLNDKGEHAVLINDFSPSSGSMQITLSDTSSFESGDTIYLNDATVAGINGMKAEVQSKTSDTITIKDSFSSVSGITFKSGSTAHRVRNVKLEVKNDGKVDSIYRSDELGTDTLGHNGSFSFTLVYLDANGNTLALPLTTSSINNRLARIRISVRAQPLQPLRDGKLYTAISEQDIMLRNMVINHPERYE